MTVIDRRTLLQGGAAAAALSALPRTPAWAASKLKVAFLYTGPIGDLGFSYQQEQARLALVQAMGDKVETKYVENVAEGPDAARVMRALCTLGTQLIYSTSFGFMNPSIQVARQFPAVKFEQVAGYKLTPNVSEYNIRWYQGRTVEGVIAGHVSKAGLCGYVASFPIPEVVMGVNAFALAARKVNPDYKVRLIWANSWFDPGKEADAAKSLIDQGCDVMAQHTDSPAIMQTAEARGVHAFGQSSDMERFGPKAQLTAVMDHWDPYVIKRAQAVIDGTWKSTNTWGGIEMDLLRFTKYGPGVTPPAAAAADAVRAAYKAGTLSPFTGPIKDQNGVVRVPAGHAMTDDELQKMDWYVEGVQV